MATRWIGVDLDGTLATLGRGGNIGEPVEPMWRRVRGWLDDGKTVKIFTVRAVDADGVDEVRQWLRERKLPSLEITNIKAPGVVAIWDDRAVRVQTDYGFTCPGCARAVGRLLSR